MATASDENAENYKLWSAAAASIHNEDRGSGHETRDAVAAQVKVLAGVDRDLVTYVAKTTPNGYRNQVWQGQGNTRANDLMVLVDTSGNEAGIASEARLRLSPREQNGFGAVVVCEPADDGWSIRTVVEYHHGGIADRLVKLSDKPIEVVRVADPSVTAPLRTPFENGPDPSALNAEMIYDHLIEAKNVVLAGPPGTGKTTLALQVAKLMGGESTESCRVENILGGASVTTVAADVIRAPDIVWDMVQMHPAFGYEEFVRGVRTDPSQKGFSLISVDGILPIMAAIAAARGTKPTLLIIDEVNRCNVSTVFGETIFAIDPGQRGRPVRLQYEASDDRDDALIIPPNLFILCTMNTADRSIAMVDFAIRRRFRFVDVPPSPDGITAFYGVQHARSKVSISIMSAINALLADPDVHVGHSYFMTAASESDDGWSTALAEKIAHEVAPLLREYAIEGKLVGEPIVAVGSQHLNLNLASTAELGALLSSSLSNFSAT